MLNVIANQRSACCFRPIHPGNRPIGDRTPSPSRPRGSALGA